MWKAARTFYQQTAYTYLGGKFPVQLTLQVASQAETYPAGEYTLDSANFIVNNFGCLEFKRFG
ncbi:G5P family DNA-binding protein [Shewanella holmiensis]|uniref:G5P family DNA-binding protein n=1 Tax=Shewanella holmiensis TaxID=2952222 RepID=UPI0021BAC6AD